MYYLFALEKKHVFKSSIAMLLNKCVLDNVTNGIVLIY